MITWSDEFPDQVLAGQSRHSRMAEHENPRYSIFWRWHTAATFVCSEKITSRLSCVSKGCQ
jgi:hypothetical protein